MSVEGATATPTATGGRGGGDSTQNDPYRFLSTRLVRELIGADSVAETAGEETAALAARMLGVVADGLSQAGAALLDAATLEVVASHGLSSEELALLRAAPPQGGTPLARRALEERRVFLFGPGSRESLLPAFREIRSDWSGLVLVPLCDRDQCAGVLALLSTRASMPAAFLRSLAPAFRLLTLLLHPGRNAGIGGDPGASGSDVERYVVEIEELRVQLAEARDQCRSLENQDSSSQAAQRAQCESLRARVAELEAALAAGGTEEGRRLEIEAEYRRSQAELEAHARRIEQLEVELYGARQLLEQAEGACRDAEARAEASSSAEEALREALNQPGLGEVEPEVAATSIPEPGGEDLELGEIAKAAAAAIGDFEDPEDSGDPTETDLSEEASDDLEGTDSRSPEAAAADDADADADCPPLGLWHLGGDPTAQAWAGELAEKSGALLWTGEGEPPRTRESLLVLNLFDDAVHRLVELSDHDVDSLVYAADLASGQGFELGSVGWVRRPLDPAMTLSRIRGRVRKRLGGIVIVSAQLRELGALRQALAEVDAAGSVACDARQATDLLEIVRRPDAVLIDLDLEKGQGLALARQLRAAPETNDVPILFLLPDEVQAQTLRADAERARLLEPYGNDDARRMLNAALAKFY